MKSISRTGIIVFVCALIVALWAISTQVEISASTESDTRIYNSAATPTPIPITTHNHSSKSAEASAPETNTPIPNVNLPVILHQPPPTATPTATSTFTPTPTRVPLFPGLTVRWDGRGFLNVGEYIEVGTHSTRDSIGMTDPDTVEFHNHHWYDPNSPGIEEAVWIDYYSISTGRFKASSVPSDPAWKWGSYWILPYDFDLSNDQTVQIGGQDFHVTGPHAGYTSFGQSVHYWHLVNKHKFLFREDSDWPQYVHPGDITLQYDMNTRLLLTRDVLRRFYYDGEETPYTVQYIEYLTSSNAYGSSLNMIVDPFPNPAIEIQEIKSEIPFDLLVPVP